VLFPGYFELIVLLPQGRSFLLFAQKHQRHNSH